MLDDVENDQDQAHVVAQMDDAENNEQNIKETFVMYRKRIQESLVQGNQNSGAYTNGEEIETN